MPLNLSSIPDSPLLISKDRKVPALEFGTSSNADVSGTNLEDANSVGITQVVVVAKPDDAHVCSKGKRRRRRDETSCRAPPSSQQNNNPQISDEEPKRDSEMKEQQDSPESMPAFAPVSESSCPEDHFPICVAPNLLENPSAPGTFDTIPWVGYNIPQTIEISEYSRFCASIFELPDFLFIRFSPRSAFV